MHDIEKRECPILVQGNAGSAYDMVRKAGQINRRGPSMWLVYICIGLNPEAPD